jgi:delta-aminolevulinic acid dehydratase/porphobilinogen synthase
MAIEIMASVHRLRCSVWDNMRAEMPELTEELLMFPLWIEVTDAQWAKIQAMPGFADGPDHVKFALIARPCNA